MNILSKVKLKIVFFVVLLSSTSLAAQQSSYFVNIAANQKPKYPANFQHFDYVNPNAPKAGELVLAVLGSFDSLNPFIVKGEAANGIAYLYDTLLVASEDEQSMAYGLLAEKIFYDDERKNVAFELRKNARFHDGTPVTAEDVVWSFRALTEQGSPLYRFYYQDVKEVTAKSRYRVEFTFTKKNLELPYILGQLIVFPKSYWQKNDFSKGTLTPPLGSGPYQIKNLSAGKFITYELNENYWGKDLPVNKGRYNFKTIRIDYYRNRDIIREALKAGKVDFFAENSAKEWATAYDVKNIKNRLIIKQLINDNTPQGLQAFAFNLRSELFQDIRVRKALNHAFDFEWLNKTFFFQTYIRSNSFFNNSEFSSRRLPSLEELSLLNPFRSQLPREVFTKTFSLPKSDGSGNNRENLKIARNLLQEAGWRLQDGKLIDPKTRKEFKFQILIVLPGFQRILTPFVQNLKRLGITAEIILLNPAQYEKRMREFDFGMAIQGFGQSDSPGNEQRDFWNSSAADKKGSRNVIGIKNPVVDQLVEKLIEAKTRKDLIISVRALDRVLLWNYYVIPMWYYPYYRVVYSSKIKMPKIMPKFSLGINNWWIDAARERQVNALLKK